jgi:hypothetical protein
MDVTALFRGTLQQAGLPAPRLELRSASIPSTSAQSATTVHISEVARSLANRAVQPKASTPEAAELRDFLRQFDFSSITPRQMAQVGGRLFEKQAISENAASAFIGVEMNLVDTMDSEGTRTQLERSLAARGRAVPTGSRDW